MKIIVDAHGGDNAPLEILKGSVLAKDEFDVDIILCGREQEIKRCAKENNINIDGMEIICASDVMPMTGNPRDIIKSGINSSIAVGLKELADGTGDAFVSAGSTGAIVIGSTFYVKRIPGVSRAALAAIMPSDTGPFMLIDCGANVECTPDMLSMFAVMGSIFMNKVLGIESPRVGIANIGTEEIKGPPFLVETYKLIKEEAKVNFIGNVEARDIPYGAADVVVCDGFTGNMFLKTFEGVSGAIMHNIKEIAGKNLFTKISALGISGGLK
ncbi:MAG: phosphate acyltransferase PlsX, partial [Oscillospiraceae bacterium]|nr:phosphate acyltransferase PlsX [Oscillospiraceae bacterium]